jgi:hypothetical protein
MACTTQSNVRACLQYLLSHVRPHHGMPPISTGGFQRAVAAAVDDSPAVAFVGGRAVGEGMIAASVMGGQGGQGGLPLLEALVSARTSMHSNRIPSHPIPHTHIAMRGIVCMDSWWRACTG